MRARITPSSNSLMLPFMPKQQPVVRAARVVDPVEIDDPRLDQAAQLEQVMPVAAVAGEPRRVEAQHSADLARAERRDQPLETGPGDHAARRAAEIVVDHLDSAEAPGVGRRRRARTGGADPRRWPRLGSGSTAAHKPPPCAAGSPAAAISLPVIVPLPRALRPRRFRQQGRQHAHHGLTPIVRAHPAQLRGRAPCVSRCGGGRGLVRGSCIRLLLSIVAMSPESFVAFRVASEGRRDHAAPPGTPAARRSPCRAGRRGRASRPPPP